MLESLWGLNSDIILEERVYRKESRAVKADEISVVEPTQPLRLARQSKDN